MMRSISPADAMRTVSQQELFERLRQGAAVVTGSARLQRTLRLRYADEQQALGETMWTTPPVLTWGAWIGTLWENLLYRGVLSDPPALLGGAQEEAIWQQVIRESPEGAQLLQPVAAAAAAASSWALLRQWRLRPEDLAGHGGEDTEAFVGWAHSFEQRCRKYGWVDSASLPDAVEDHLAHAGLPHTLIFAGFDDWTPQQAAFAAACGGVGCEVYRLAPEAGEQAATLRRTVANSDREEIQAAANWARDLLESGAGGPIGIVFPDLAERRNLVERIFAFTFDPESRLPGNAERPQAFNISAGRPLGQYPVVHAALQVLKVRSHGNDFSDIGMLLRCPFLAGAKFEKSSRGRLDVVVREKGGPMVDLDWLAKKAEERYCGDFAKLLRSIEAVLFELPDRQSPSDWVRTFTQILNASGWPGQGLTSHEHQAVKAFREVLDDASSLDAVAGALSLNEMLPELQRLTDERTFQPEGPDAPVQIMGLLEASGMRFEHLWIAGMHDEAWPQPSRPDPFIPLSVQRRHGMPHSSPQRELAFAQRLTDALLTSAPDVVVSHARTDGDRERGVSPLLSHIGVQEAADIIPAEYPSLVVRIRKSAEVEQEEDTLGPPVSEEVVEGGTSIFEFQSACPFRAFAQTRLAAKPLETPEEGLDAAGRGSEVHFALEFFWRETRTLAVLQGMSESEKQQRIAECVDSALVRLEAERKRPLPPRFRSLEHRRLCLLLREWLDVETRRSPFEVLQQEEEVVREFGGIRFRVRMDRVDRLAGDGEREVIIDYKTGFAASSQWKGERPEKPQVPLYAVIHDRPVAGVLFGQVKTGKSRWHACCEDDVFAKPPRRTKDDMPFSEQLPEWKDVLSGLAADYRKGKAAVDPKKSSACTYCDLPVLCRVSETVREPEDAPNGGEE